MLASSNKMNRSIENDSVPLPSPKRRRLSTEKAVVSTVDTATTTKSHRRHISWPETPVTETRDDCNPQRNDFQPDEIWYTVSSERISAMLKALDVRMTV